MTIKSEKNINRELLPKFIIAGFPRCGTTALMVNLGQHPDIYVPKKEMWFFQKEQLNIKEYMSNFKYGKINGEKTPIYALDKNAMKNMAKFVPDVKIILCVRHPVQALHSFYNWKAFEFASGSIDFGIDVRKISFEKIVLDEVDFHWLNVEVGCFTKHIKQKVLKYFDKKQIKICIQEEMLIHPERAFNEIFSFIGVKSKKIKNMKMKFHDAKFRYKSIDYKSKNYPIVVEKLLSLYKPYNQKLFNFLGRDIREWHLFDRHYSKFLK